MTSWKLLQQIGVERVLENIDNGALCIETDVRFEYSETLIIWTNWLVVSLDNHVINQLEIKLFLSIECLSLKRITRLIE